MAHRTCVRKMNKMSAICILIGAFLIEWGLCACTLAAGEGCVLSLRTHFDDWFHIFIYKFLEHAKEYYRIIWILNLALLFYVPDFNKSNE